MTTPLATIADALIEFILSLLNDPAAAEEFDEDPQGAMSRAGLSDACVEDVRAVAPVIVDRPDVHHKPSGHHGHHNPPGPPTVEKEIMNITNSFAIDNRSTIVDQSVNQNIWADGDVNQIFDQDAVVNSGDNGVAAGDDAEVDNSETDVEVGGDVSVGNEDTTTNIDGSFNETETETETETDVEVDDSFNDESTDTDVDVEVDDSFNDTTTTDVETEVEFSNEGNIASDGAVVVEDVYVEAEPEPEPVMVVEEAYVEPESDETL